VVLLERDPALAACLRQSQQRLKAEALRVEAVDAVAWMGRAAPGSFDLVLLDPPFGSDLARQALPQAQRVLAEDGFIYLEARQALPAAPEGWAIHRRGRAGAVHFHLLRRGRDGYTPGHSGPPRRNEP
jgi:16S rRNA G966 N2-methylase RsmD